MKCSRINTNVRPIRTKDKYNEKCFNNLGKFTSQQQRYSWDHFQNDLFQRMNDKNIDSQSESTQL